MTPQLREPEVITASKEFCDCEFSWYSAKDGAHGVSIGKTLPAIPEEASHQYPREDFTVENAAKINASGLCFEDYIAALQQIAG